MKTSVISSREGVCPLHGEYGKKIYSIAGARFEVCLLCEKENEQRRRKEETELEINAAKQRYTTIIQLSGIGRRYYKCGFTNYNTFGDPEREGLLKVLKEYVDGFERNNGESLIFLGTTGSGKTHLACSVIKGLAKRGYSSKYLTAAGLFREIRSCYSPSSALTEAKYFDMLGGLDFLVVDEACAKDMSADEHSNLFSVIDSRYVNCKSSILISNKGVEEFRAMMGARISDRLNEIAKTVVFHWSSCREAAGIKGGVDGCSF